MVIYVSDSGIYKSNSTYPLNTSANASPVSKIKPIQETKESTGSVVREAQQAYVAENTPAYNISISSLGRAAIGSLKKFNEGLNKINDLADIKNNRFAVSDNLSLSSAGKEASELKKQDSGIPSIYDSAMDIEKSGSVFAASDETSSDSTLSIQDSREDAESSTSVNTSNLARYSDFQLQQLVNDGTISQSEYNSELEKRTVPDEAAEQIEKVAASPLNDPVMRQAIAAYNFQAAYQINAAILQ